ncbi:uncharacterized protein EAF01_009177 [Botrytis porri]|uniref:uncharacterized protein n=1 Tax=Botrytis porri TaxID=87229 RepID=UPI00190059F2|nr:uncharacterized protein EAF01_009177 [Botrytis porri]KAF7896774.1 hypothetical protein EAF01_009177 [Botrytis porri]
MRDPQLLKGKVLEPAVANCTSTDVNKIEEVSLILSSLQEVASPVLLDVHEASMVSNPLQISDIIADDIMSLELHNENWNSDIEELISEHMDISFITKPTRSSPRPFPIDPSPILASYQPKDITYYALYQPTPQLLLPEGDDELPPFIHPNFNNRKALPAPLATCAVLAQWISVKNEDNVLFIWGCIRMEIDRICAQYTTYSIEDSVATLQAITIYFILRLSEDNEKATSFDVRFISTMIKVSMQVAHLAEDLQNEVVPSWKEWALAESICRTIIILFFVDLFYDVSSSVTEYRCDGNRLKYMALPCSRKLWRATRNEAWEIEYTNSMRGERLTYGDLINSRNRPQDRTLDGWLSQLDDFGMLVLAAASLAS